MHSFYKVAIGNVAGDFGALLTIMVQFKTFSGLKSIAILLTNNKNHLRIKQNLGASWVSHAFK